MKIVALSDTHTFHREVPKIMEASGDVLIFAGDFMGSGYRHHEVKDFGEWFSSVGNFKYRVLVAGNHDRMMESNRLYCLEKFSKDVIYLENQEVTLDGIKFYGSPVQPEFYNWAFNVPRGEKIKKYWDMIPEDTNVLITHGPPYGILDKCLHEGIDYGSVGCKDLREAIDNRLCCLESVIFGHIHHNYGKLAPEDRESYFEDDPGPTFYNVSICNENYKVTNHVTE